MSQLLSTLTLLQHGPLGPLVLYLSGGGETGGQGDEDQAGHVRCTQKLCPDQSFRSVVCDFCWNTKHVCRILHPNPGGREGRRLGICIVDKLLQDWDEQLSVGITPPGAQPRPACPQGSRLPNA